MSETGLVGGSFVVASSSPAKLETDRPHTLVDGDLVRLDGGTNGAEPASEELFVKISGSSDRQCSLFADERLKTPAKLAYTYPSGATLARLAKEDCAVVVGISKYFAMTPLSGPEKDAVAFRRWVRSASGGAVPDSHVRLILSSMFATPSEPSAIKPTLDDMKGEFKRYADSSATKQGYRVGRRLYIFLSGHGITPTRSTTANFEEPALLAANATKMSAGEHILGAAYAEWFRNHAIFDEVVLFADCCRDLKDNVAPMPVPFPTFRPERQPGRRFYAAATKLNSKAFEKECGTPPSVRGVFSYVLINALESEELKNASGWLTGSVLAHHLYQAVPQHQKGQDPVIDYRPDEDIQFVHRHTSPVNVSITFPTAWIGKRAELFGRKYPDTDAEHVITGDPWTMSLDMAMYKVRVENGKSRHFEVDGTAGVQNVSFV